MGEKNHSILASSSEVSANLTILQTNLLLKKKKTHLEKFTMG